ncbi:MAG: hypothetical protein VB122_04875 [Erysipelotrichales bacterium]|nr:hypothetical protein [Erysipelotrichales bacterium]
MKGICFVEPLFTKVVDGSKCQTRRIIKKAPEHLSEVELAKLLAKCKYGLSEVVYLKEPYIDDLSMEDTLYKYLNEDPIILNYSYAWKNKLFMPESAARYFIKITGVKIEKLQEISDEDCFKEGIYKNDYGFSYPGCKVKWSTPQVAYKFLIDKINGLATFQNNPYVYVYDFELIEL